MFQEMDEALYEDCRLRFEDDEVGLAHSDVLTPNRCLRAAGGAYEPAVERRINVLFSCAALLRTGARELSIVTIFSQVDSGSNPR